MSKMPRWSVLLALACLLILGVALRLYKFPSVPAGLHQDEMSEAYEAYSLLHTGKDRWGDPWPAYFLGWGSGQNVMQSYLTIPVVATFGLTRLTARMVPMICGLLSLPLLFFTMRRWYGETASLAALLFLACSPWGVMISRNGIENVPLPFFLLLGVYTFGLALESESPPLIVLSLLPFSGALYCYGTVAVIMPFFLFLLGILGFEAIRKRVRSWAVALALFAVCGAPIALFVLKNYVVKRNFGFERRLPFTIPLLPLSRLDQAKAELAGDSALWHNLKLVRHGMSDGVSWFQVLGVHPLAKLVLLLAGLGILWECRNLIRNRRFEGPFLPWLIACVPVFVAIPLNISRAIVVFVPLIALAGVGFDVLVHAVHGRIYRFAVVGVCAFLLLKPTWRFVHDYYGPVYRDEIASTFYPEMPAALDRVQALGPAPTTPIYISDTILLNYVDVLFYLKIDPHTYQASGATWSDPDFGRFRFSRATALQAGRPLVFLLAHDEPPLCNDSVATSKVGGLTLGMCP